MNEEKKKDGRIGLLIGMLIVFVFYRMVVAVVIGGHDVEKVREKIEKELYKEYGEEFVVDRIGTRKYPDGKTRFVARIYPESIIGTNKEGDSYYYASAGVEKKSFGRLGGVGTGYETVLLKLETEEYLLPKIKELFGERTLQKVDVKYKKRKEGNDYFSWQLVSGFEELLEKTRKDPENHRIELQLYLYIFDRIDNEEEKEERRKQIFDFVQYLKKEGLFRYLELGVIFIDERVLAPSYRRYKYDLNYGEKIKEVVEGEEVYLPPMELRKEMSKVLQEEIDRMSEKGLIANMREIQKDELTYKNLDKFNASHYGFVYSVGILEVKYGSSYEKYKKNNTLDHYCYNTISDVKIGKNLEYIYLD